MTLVGNIHQDSLLLAVASCIIEDSKENTLQPVARLQGLAQHLATQKNILGQGEYVHGS